MIIRPYIILQIVFEIFSNLSDQMSAVFAVNIVVVAGVDKVVHLFLVVDCILQET